MLYLFFSMALFFSFLSGNEYRQEWNRIADVFFWVTEINKENEVTVGREYFKEMPLMNQYISTNICFFFCSAPFR